MHTSIYWPQQHKLIEYVKNIFLQILNIKSIKTYYTLQNPQLMSVTKPTHFNISIKHYSRLCKEDHLFHLFELIVSSTSLNWLQTSNAYTQLHTQLYSDHIVHYTDLLYWNVITRPEGWQELLLLTLSIRLHLHLVILTTTSGVLLKQCIQILQYSDTQGLTQEYGILQRE